MRRRTISFFAIALLACGDSTGPRGLNGVISFTFTGAGGGFFDVTALAPNTGETPDLSRNLTAGYSNDTVTLVAAFRAIGSGFGDAVALGLTSATVGSASVDVDCDPEGTTVCALLVFARNFNTATEATGQTCTLYTGTVAITQITASRIVGTFSGAGECVDELEDASPFGVTNGTFNVSRLTISE